jgi:HTH-type transcriptional regulator, fmd operon transcriptional regulator
VAGLEEVLNLFFDLAIQRRGQVDSSCPPWDSCEVRIGIILACSSTTLLSGPGIPADGLSKKPSFLRTTLTARQWEVIRARAHGMTQAQLAKRLKTSRENVNEIEHRARMKIDAAKATIAALQDLEATGEILIPSGTSIFEALCMVFVRADILGVKLSTNADEMLAMMRSGWKGKIRGHRLTSAAKIGIASDGTLLVKKTL